MQVFVVHGHFMMIRSTCCVPCVPVISPWGQVTLSFYVTLIIFSLMEASLYIYKERERQSGKSDITSLL